MSDIPVAAPAAPAAPSTTSAPKPAAPSASVSAPAASKTEAPVSGSMSASKAASGLPNTKLPFQDDASAPAPGNNHPDAKPGETKAETVQRMKLKTKVNGREEEREYTTDELQLYVQKGLGADEKFNKAAEVQKTFQKFVEDFKKNPFEAAKDPAIGVDLKQMAIEYLAKEFEAEDLKAKDPREFELQELRAFKAQQEAERQAVEAARQAKAQEEVQKMQWEQMRKEWAGALTESGFAENEQMIRQMAEIGRDFLDADMDLNPKMLVTELKRRVAEQNRMLYSSLEGDALENALGSDIVNKILRHKVSKLNSTRELKPIEPETPVAAPSQTDKSEKIERPTKYLSSMRDFMRAK